MNRSQAQGLLASKDLSASINIEASSLNEAFDHLKQSSHQLIEAEARHRFWNRKLQKSKAQSANARKHGEKCRFVRELAQFDKNLKRWNQAREDHLLDVHHSKNSQSRRKHEKLMQSISDQRTSRSHLRYQSIKEEQARNESMSNGFKRERQRILSQRRSKAQLREKRSIEKINRYHQDKIDMIRRSSKEEADRLMRQSSGHKIQLEGVIKSNARLHRKKLRQSAKLDKLLQTSGFSLPGRGCNPEEAPSDV